MGVSQLIQALQVVLHATTAPGDAVAMHTPAYPPFLKTLADMGRRLVPIPMAGTAAGWAFDADGKCVDMPSEPAPFCDKVKIKAYPTRESGGIIWAYLGPKETMTPFRDFGTEVLMLERNERILAEVEEEIARTLIASLEKEITVVTSAAVLATALSVQRVATSTMLAAFATCAPISAIEVDNSSMADATWVALSLEPSAAVAAARA